MATSVVGASLLFVFIDQLGVPPALTWLMHIEQLTYRAGHSNPPPVSLVAAVWPLFTLVCAFVIDLCMQRARQQGWSARRLFVSLALLVALVGGIPLSLEAPLGVLEMAGALGVLGTLLSYAIGCFGAIVGIMLGRSVGETTRVLER
jgi:hypothetical protein